MAVNAFTVLQPALIGIATIILMFAAPLIRFEHIFTHYDSDKGRLVVDCGAVWASSSADITVPYSLDACDELITAINTDDGAVYLVVDPASATYMAWMSIFGLALTTIVFIGAAIEVAAAYNSKVWVSVQQCNILASIVGWLMIVFATRARAAASAAPDPGAKTIVTLTLYARVLAAFPLINLSRDILRLYAKKNA